MWVSSVLCVKHIYICHQCLGCLMMNIVFLYFYVKFKMFYSILLLEKA